jgi:phage-related holin
MEAAVETKRRVAKWVALVAGAMLCGTGILHDLVNLPSFTRAVARGMIAERIGPDIMANVTFAGMAMSLCGLLLVLVAHDLDRGSRTAWRVVLAIGLFWIANGVAAYIWLPVRGGLIFTVFGATVCAPLVAWSGEFRAERG